MDEKEIKEIDRLYKENRRIFKDLKKTIDSVFAKESQLSKRIQNITDTYNVMTESSMNFKR